MTSVALYCRVSTEAQVEKYGLGVQEHALRERAEQRGYAISGDGERELFVDDGYSGGDMDRPALGRLREVVQQGAVEVVLAYDPDRLSRSLADLLLLTDEFERRHVRLEFLTQETDASPEGRLFFAIKGAVGEFERAKTRQRTQHGIMEKARQGKVVSRHAAPYGYRFHPETSTLDVMEDEAAVVRMAFSLYTEERISITELSDRFNRFGIARPAGGHRWHASFLGRLLRNEAYIGTLWQNRWRHGPDPKDPRRVGRVHILPKEQQIATPVPPIVAPEMFETAQRRLEENQRFALRNTRHAYLLAGLVRHACGSKMGGHTPKKGSPYYRCYHSQTFKAAIDSHGIPQPCACAYVNGHMLEDAVWASICGLLKNPELLAKEVQRLQEPGTPTRLALETELELLGKRSRELPQEEDRLIGGFRRGLFEEAGVRRELGRIGDEKAAIEARQRELQRQVELHRQASALASSVTGFAARMNRGLERMAFDQQRELLRLLVEEVVVYDEGQLTIRTILPVTPLYPTSQGVRGRGKTLFRPS